MLHPKSQPPNIVPFGKIAGVEEIAVSRIPLSEKDTGFWLDVVGGSAFVQVSRLITYGVSFAFLLVLSVVAILGATLLRDWFRKRRVNRSSSLKSHSNPEQVDELKKHYVNNGLDGLKKLKATLDAPIPILRGARVNSFPELELRDLHLHGFELQYSGSHLEHIGALTKESRKRTFTINQDFLATLNKLLAEFGE